ncbi:MAG: metallophosphoesterase [Acidobacteriota bacterium]
MSEKRIHREEYLYLPALTHDAALLAWGAFFFKVKQDDGREKWELLDDDDLREKAGRKQSIGERAEPYAAQATVLVTEIGTGATHTHSVTVNRANHALVRGLKPDTEYSYRVVVHEAGGNEHEWAAGQLYDWDVQGDEPTMKKSTRSYQNRFRTFPAPHLPATSLRFAVLGDFGRGIRKRSSAPRCQREVAEALDQAFADQPFRFIVTTGDNIYAKTFLGIPTSSSGDEDDDWFFTYFQPYRYLLNRVPVFPVIGNHDDDENEHPVDRLQIYDNLYLRLQARDLQLDAVFDHGLLYRFRFGAEVEFVMLDTSKGRGGKLHFEFPQNQSFIARAFSTANAPRWRIPVSHHPAYCAGPRHGNTESLRAFLQQHGAAAGIRVSFSGHEHNFQFSCDEAGVAHFLTGGGGKFRESEPDDFQKAKTQVWGGNNEGHFLLVDINGNEMSVTPFGHLHGNELRPIAINHVTGNQRTPPFRV